MKVTLRYIITPEFENLSIINKKYIFERHEHLCLETMPTHIQIDEDLIFKIDEIIYSIKEYKYILVYEKSNVGKYWPYNIREGSKTEEEKEINELKEKLIKNRFKQIK